MQLAGGWWRSGKVRAATLVVLAVVGGITAPLATIDTGPGGPGVLGIELVGQPAEALRWVRLYGVDDVYRALAFDVLFILCWSALLALLSVWIAPAFRTR